MFAALLPACAVAMPFTGGAQEIQREELVAGLRYGVSFRFEMGLHTSEIDRDSSGDPWLDSLLARYADEEAHPGNWLARAREAIADGDASAARAELGRAMSALVARHKESGAELPNDLAFLLGYGYSLLLQIGANLRIIEDADPILRGVFERDATWWRAMRLLAWMHEHAASRELAAGAPERAEERYERARDVLTAALEWQPREPVLRHQAARVRQSLWTLRRCDLETPECRRELLDIWDEMRAAAEGENASAVRAIASFHVAQVMLVMNLGTEIPDDLLAVAPDLLEDFEAARSIDVFVGRMTALIWIV